jgi:multicomponent Na+:H+ antiporter subunit D
VVYVWKMVELLFLRPLSEPDTQVREAPASLLIPMWVLVIANIYFGINTELTVDIAETAARILGVTS